MLGGGRVDWVVDVGVLLVLLVFLVLLRWWWRADRLDRVDGHCQIRGEWRRRSYPDAGGAGVRQHLDCRGCRTSSPRFEYGKRVNARRAWARVSLTFSALVGKSPPARIEMGISGPLQIARVPSPELRPFGGLIPPRGDISLNMPCSERWSLGRGAAPLRLAPPYVVKS